jgi:ADP-ribosylglycohydrolase
MRPATLGAVAGDIIGSVHEFRPQKTLQQPGQRLRTCPFMEGSYFEESWNAGERIRFLAPDGTGMTSVIAENRPFSITLP